MRSAQSAEQRPNEHSTGSARQTAPTWPGFSGSSGTDPLGQQLPASNSRRAPARACRIIAGCRTSRPAGLSCRARARLPDQSASRVELPGAGQVAGPVAAVTVRSGGAPRAENAADAGGLLVAIPVEDRFQVVQVPYRGVARQVALQGFARAARRTPAFALRGTEGGTDRAHAAEPVAGLGQQRAKLVRGVVHLPVLWVGTVGHGPSLPGDYPCV